MKKALVLSILGALAAGACADDSGATGDGLSNADLPRSVDVAENMARFVFDSEPLHEDGMPAYGNSFITEGYLYPSGHLDERSGVNTDGSPADPDAVIGTWTCRGFFVGDGAHTTSGPVVITTQLLNFYDTPGYDPAKATGATTLVTEGYEFMEPGFRARRAVTGGTGPYFEAGGGQVSQEFLGFNVSQGVDLRIDL